MTSKNLLLIVLLMIPIEIEVWTKWVRHKIIFQLNSIIMGCTLFHYQQFFLHQDSRHIISKWWYQIISFQISILSILNLKWTQEWCTLSQWDIQLSLIQIIEEIYKVQIRLSKRALIIQRVYSSQLLEHQWTNPAKLSNQRFQVPRSPLEIACWTKLRSMLKTWQWWISLVSILQ